MLWITFLLLWIYNFFFLNYNFFFLNIKQAEHMLQKEPNRESFVVVVMKKVIH